MDLAYCFLKWSPLHIYASLIYLEYDAEYAPFVEDRHWRFSLFGRNRSECQMLFHILGMEYKPLTVRESKNDFRSNKNIRYAARPSDGKIF